MALMLTGCGAGGLSVANGVGLGAISVTLACDWRQTRAFASEGWTYQLESNPILGERPTTQSVDAYFLAAMVAATAVWRLTPRKWRLLPALAIVALQVKAIAVTHQNATEPKDPGLCAFD